MVEILKYFFGIDVVKHFLYFEVKAFSVAIQLVEQTDIVLELRVIVSSTG